MTKIFGEENSINNFGTVQYDVPQKYLSETDRKQALENIGDMPSVCTDVLNSLLVEKDEFYYINKPIEENSLCFSFEKLDFDPNTLNVEGTWKKEETEYANIWTYTNANNDWHTLFGGGSATNPGKFGDENNKVKILAIEVSNVTDMSRLFQNCYFLTEIYGNMTATNCTTTYLIFSHCENLTYVHGILDFSNVTNTVSMFQSCYKLKELPYIILPTDHNYSLEFLCTNCYDLNYVPKLDTSKCVSFAQSFRLCHNLRAAPDFNTSSCSSMKEMFCGHVEGTQSNDTILDMHISAVPNYDYSNVLVMSFFMDNNKDITYIPDMGTLNPKLRNIKNSFRDCVNVSAGAYDFYSNVTANGNVTAVTGQQDAFKNCGINSETGVQDLYKIPKWWGGYL